MPLDIATASAAANTITRRIIETSSRSFAQNSIARCGREPHTGYSDRYAGIDFGLTTQARVLLSGVGIIGIGIARSVVDQVQDHLSTAIGHVVGEDTARSTGIYWPQDEKISFVLHHPVRVATEF